MLVEHPGELEPHEERAGLEARAGRDLNAAVGSLKLHGRDAYPLAGGRALEMLDDVLHKAPAYGSAAGSVSRPPLFMCGPLHGEPWACREIIPESCDRCLSRDRLFCGYPQVSCRE